VKGRTTLKRDCRRPNQSVRAEKAHGGEKRDHAVKTQKDKTKKRKNRPGPKCNQKLTIAGKKKKKLKEKMAQAWQRRKPGQTRIKRMGFETATEKGIKPRNGVPESKKAKQKRAAAGQKTNGTTGKSKWESEKKSDLHGKKRRRKKNQKRRRQRKEKKRVKQSQAVEHKATRCSEDS